MKNKHTHLTMLLVLILLVTGANVLLTLRVKPCEGEKPHLPCSELPIRFIKEHPACADELLKTMGITNVHVVPYNATRPVPENQTISRASAPPISAREGP